MPYNAFASDYFSNSIDLTFTVNIEAPVCKLEHAEQLIDFGDLSVHDITVGNTTKSARFSFAGCTNVDTLTISFTGESINKNENYIKNKTGPNNASGIGIRLYDENHREIILGEDNSQLIGKDSTEFELLIHASIGKENNNSLIQAGIIDTSVSFTITYN